MNMHILKHTIYICILILGKYCNIYCNYIFISKLLQSEFIQMSLHFMNLQTAVVNMGKVCFNLLSISVCSEKNNENAN